MAGIEPRGGRHEKSYKERLVELRAELTKAISFEIVTPELYQSQMIQVLNGLEGIKIKSQKEIERLTNLIGEEQGRLKACNDMGDLVVSIISAFNTQEVRRREEEALLANENAEKAKYVAQEAAQEATGKASAPEPEKPKEAEKPVSEIPGVRIIPSKSPKK
jgi:hypothetical protein